MLQISVYVCKYENETCCEVIKYEQSHNDGSTCTAVLLLSLHHGSCSFLVQVKQVKM